MFSKLRWLLLASLYLLASTSGLQAEASPEIRGIWVDTWGSGFKSAAQIDQLVLDVQRGNLNTIFPQVRRRADAFYNSSIEPKNGSVSPGNFDPLAYLIQKAHAANPPIEVHAWIITFPIGVAQGNPDHILNKHPEWLMESMDGSKQISNEYWADPGHPEVQQHIVDVARDLIGNYSLDGFHFDYIRYPSPDWGYNPLSVARFNHRFGLSGKPSSNNAAWKQFRRDAVTELVRRIYLEGISLKPSIKISAATIGQGGGITKTSQWGNSSAYSARLQDWRAWMEEGILDLNAPMLYYDAQGSWAHGWSNWLVFAKNHKYGRHMAPGPAWYMNTVSDSLTQINQARQPTSAGNRSDGVVGYNYATTNNQKVPRWSFLNTLSNSSGPFAEKAPIPVMPWKTNPTRGFAKGIVTADDTQLPLDRATVTFTGPTTRTISTDGNGFYGAVNLLPGLYTVTASMPKAAYDPASAQITITAGVVASTDLVLEFAPAAEIILDDDDAELQGSWTESNNPSQFGSTYRVAWPVNPSGSATSRATYRPTISIPGTYEIHVWYVSGGNRSEATPHTIQHSRGQTLVPVDQRSGGGGWQLLAGNIHFNSGSDGFVQIANNAPGSVVVADAVRFSLLEADPDPNEFFKEPLVHAGAGQAIVTWETVGVSRVKVEYGTSQLTAITSSETTATVLEHSVTLLGLQSETTYQYRLHARVGTSTYASNWRQFQTNAPAEIIVDNQAASYSGNWTTGSTGSQQYGNNYHLSYGGSSGATATFRPNLPIEGIYDVYTWYVSGGNRAWNLPHLINHADGELTVTVDQRSNGAGWRLLTSGKRFKAGTSGFLKITNNGTAVTIADAQRWVLRDSNPAHSLIAQTEGSGTVTRDPSASGYEHGSQVELTATPASGWSFSHWEGDLGGNESSASIRLYRDREVTAVFHPLFELATSISGEGTVEVALNETTFPSETEVEVLAVPAPGWTFLHWDGHLPGDENPALVWMDGEKSLTANFGFSYDVWSQTVFSESDQADPAISGPEADPHGHGIPNLLKYAFGLDPQNPDFSRLPNVDTGADGLLLRFHRLRKPAGIDYVVETSTDLSTWSATPALFTEISATPNTDGKTEEVTVQSTTPLSESQPRIFVRVRIDQH